MQLGPILVRREKRIPHIRQAIHGFFIDRFPNREFRNSLDPCRFTPHPGNRSARIDKMSPAIRRSRTTRHRGYALLWCLFSLLLLLSFGVIAIEITMLRVAQSRAQIAAEAAALAAAGSLRNGRETAAEDAAGIAAMNRGNGGPVVLLSSSDNSTGDLRFGHWNPETKELEEDLLAPDAVSVTVSFSDQHPNGSVGLLFGGLLGLEQVDVGARATVSRRPRLPVPISTWILDPIKPHVIELRESTLEVNGGLVVSSTSIDAVTVVSNSLLDATLLDLDGGVNIDSDDSIRGLIRQFDGPTDPPSVPQLNLAALPNRLGLIDVSGTLILEPGNYTNGLIGTEGQYVLQEGVYIFGEPGINLSRNATIQSENSIIVLGEGASLRISGTTCTIAAQTEVGDVDNPDRIAIISTNERSELLIQNGGLLSVNGMVNCPSAVLDCSSGTVEATRIVVKELEADRTSLIRIGEETPHPIDLLMVE